EPEPEVDPATKAERLKEQGNQLFKQKKYQEAINLYSQAIDLNPNEPNYLTNRAAAQMALKRFKPSLADCQQAATLQASAPSAKTLTRLARCHLALGNPALAIKTLQQALDVEPGNATTLQQQQAAKTMQSYITSVQDAMAKGDWSFARLALDKATDACEGDAPVAWRLWRVRIDLARKQFDAAAIAASDALRLDQNAPDALALRGLVLFVTNKTQQAIQHAQQALRSDPEHKAARLLLRRARDVERVKEEGNNAFKAGRTEEAIAKYTETLDIIGQNVEEGNGGPLRATLLSNRATAYLKINKTDEAISDADECIAISPLQWKALRTRARAKLAKDSFEEAMQDFRAALDAAQGETGLDASVERSLKDELRKAEVALKRSKTKDYYKILGLERSCSEQEIRKAYRRESLKHHPDKGGDEEQFKLVAEANAVLSDPQRRQRYDDGEDEDGMSNSGPDFGFGPNIDISQLFAHMHGGRGGGYPFGGGAGGRGFGG
ncbi:protein prenylyltransferase, partial [Auricularia subglabra TFB-10046 SS5]